MVLANNYETMSTFVKVMQEKLWPLFSGHGVQSLNKIFNVVAVSIKFICNFLSVIEVNGYRISRTGWAQH